MRKFITLLLAIVMCVSFVACGAHKDIQSSEQMQDCVCSIKVKINPQFEIFLNSEYVIVQIDYLNADAQYAFSDIDILSVPFDEGFLKLMDTLYTKGYIKDNSAQITWTLQKVENAEIDESIVVNDFEKVINTFSYSNDVAVSVCRVAADDDAMQLEQQVDTNGVALEDEWELLDNIIIERDANGNIEKYIETDDAGNQFIYNAQKQLTGERIYTENGYVERSYDGNGNVIQDEQEIVDEWERMDNISVERDADGNVIHYVETDSNGSKITYNANKQKVHALIYHETGYSEKYYDENGRITKHIIIENDGSQTEFFYYLNGNKKQVYTLFANGEFKDEYYDESGNRIKFIERRNTSGGAYVIDYDTDGNGNTDYQNVYAADGTIWYNEFDANGNQILEKQKQIQ